MAGALKNLGLRQKAHLGWDFSSAISCCVTLEMGLTLSESQFPGSKWGSGHFTGTDGIT